MTEWAKSANCKMTKARYDKLTREGYQRLTTEEKYCWLAMWLDESEAKGYVINVSRAADRLEAGLRTELERLGLGE